MGPNLISRFRESLKGIGYPEPFLEGISEYIGFEDLSKIIRWTVTRIDPECQLPSPSESEDWKFDFVNDVVKVCWHSPEVLYHRSSGSLLDSLAIQLSY